jgi:hypothetical protein
LPAVPKTLPPDADGPATPSPVGGTPLGGFGGPGMQPWQGASAQAAAGFASTEPRQPYQPNGGGSTSFASPMELSPRPSGTAIGGPGYNGGGTAPMSHPYAVAPTAPAPSVEPRRTAARGGGPPLLLILLLAGGVASAVVGGLYAANRFAKFEDKQKDVLITPLPTAAVQSDPPSNRPPVSVPPTAVRPPPIVATPPRPTPRPSTSPGPGPAPQPSSQPSGQPPIIPSTLPPIVFPPGIPSTLPFPLPPFGQFPGQPAQQDPPQQQPPGGANPPGGNQPPPGGTSPAPSGTGRRPGGIILIPRH